MNAIRQELPPVINSPRFQVTYCSQCGAAFGPGNHGYSQCGDHKNASWHKANDSAAMKLQVKTQYLGA